MYGRNVSIGGILGPGATDRYMPRAGSGKAGVDLKGGPTLQKLLFTKLKLPAG